MLAKDVPLGVFAFSSDGLQIGRVVSTADHEVWIELGGETVRLAEEDLEGVTTGELALRIDARTVDTRPHNLSDARR